MTLLTIVKSTITILFLWVVGVLTVSVAYGAFSTIPLVNIVFASILFVVLPLTLILDKAIKINQPLIHLVLAVTILSIFTSGKQRIVADIACRSQGGIGLSEIIKNENLAEKTVTFCGHLQRCVYISLELKPVQYEVCSISDIWNDAHQIQFYTSTLSNSDDPLVQASHDSQLLSGLPKDTIIIDTGFRGTSYYPKCWFDEMCSDSSQIATNVFRNKNMQQLTIEPTR